MDGERRRIELFPTERELKTKVEGRTKIRAISDAADESEDRW